MENTEILTSAQVAKLTHTHLRTVQRQCEAGIFPPSVCGRVGRYYLFNRQALMEFIFKNPKEVA